MAKQISHNRNKAKKMYLESNEAMKLIDVAVTLNLKGFQIRKWKSQDKQEDELEGAVPKVNKNALGNCGGNLLKNKSAEIHVFSKYLPEEALELIEAIKEKNPLDILCEFIFKKGDKKSPPFY